MELHIHPATASEILYTTHEQAVRVEGLIWLQARVPQALRRPAKHYQISTDEQLVLVGATTMPWGWYLTYGRRAGRNPAGSSRNRRNPSSCSTSRSSQAALGAACFAATGTLAAVRGAAPSAAAGRPAAAELVAGIAAGHKPAGLPAGTLSSGPSCLMIFYRRGCSVGGQKTWVTMPEAPFLAV